MTTFPSWRDTARAAPPYFPVPLRPGSDGVSSVWKIDRNGQCVKVGQILQHRGRVEVGPEAAMQDLCLDLLVAESDHHVGRFTVQLGI